MARGLPRCAPTPGFRCYVPENCFFSRVCRAFVSKVPPLDTFLLDQTLIFVKSRGNCGFWLAWDGLSAWGTLAARALHTEAPSLAQCPRWRRFICPKVPAQVPKGPTEGKKVQSTLVMSKPARICPQGAGWVPQARYPAKFGLKRVPISAKFVPLSLHTRQQGVKMGQNGSSWPQNESKEGRKRVNMGQTGAHVGPTD